MGRSVGKTCFYFLTGEKKVDTESVEDRKSKILRRTMTLSYKLFHIHQEFHRNIHSNVTLCCFQDGSGRAETGIIFLVMNVKLKKEC